MKSHLVTTLHITTICSILLYGVTGMTVMGLSQGVSAQAVLEEIVVTARKREESLQDTPISITAFTGDALEQQHIQNLAGIAGFTPNMEFDDVSTFSGSNSAASVFIRGIGQVDFTLTTEPGVGIYLDGVYISQSIGGVLNLVDIDRVSVLRGPQGTLFGRNTIGGAINVVSKLPEDKFYGDVKLTTGSYDRIDGRASVNVPVTDKLYAKASVASLNRDGYVSAPNARSGNDLGDVDQEVARLALRYVPNDKFEANFSFDYSRQRENGVPHVLVNTFEGQSLARIFGGLNNPASPLFRPPPAPLDAPSFVDVHNLIATVPFGQQGGIAGLTPGVVPNPVFGQPTVTAADVRPLDNDDLINFSTMDLSSETDVWGAALTLSYELEWATLKSITSFRNMEARTGYDIDGLAVSIGDLVDNFDVDQFSQEIQLLGEAMDGRLNWVVGFYHFTEDGINRDDVEFTLGRFLSGAEIDNRSTAGFAQITYDVTDKLSITGGLRYTDENKEFIVGNECLPLPKGPQTLFDGTVVTCTPLQTVIDPKIANQGALFTINSATFPIIDPVTGTIFNPLGLPLANARLCCLPVSDASGNVVGLLNGLTPGTEILPRGTTEESFSDLTPHASITYNWTDDFMTYFSYSEGFKSGGFVQRVFPPKTEVPSFDVETAEVFEIGMKWTGLDNRVRVSAAGFFTDYQDLHVQINDNIAPVTRNAAAAEINGFELETVAIPADGWLVQAGVGYMNAEYTELDPSQNFSTDVLAISLDSALVNAPEWSANLGIQYAYNLAGAGQIVTRLDWSFRSEIAKDALNFPELIQDDYSLFDASLTYISANDRWEVSFFGKNLTDETYIVSGFANGLTQGRSTVNVGRPAEWGASFSYRFGD